MSVKIHGPFEQQKQKAQQNKTNHLFQVGQTKEIPQIWENLFLQDLQTNISSSKVFIEANKMLAVFPS